MSLFSAMISMIRALISKGRTDEMSLWNVERRTGKKKTDLRVSYCLHK